MPEKILIIDDSFETRLLLMRTLEKAGYKAIGAVNGQEGVSLACELLPELILLDIVMPGLDGYQVCEALKAELRTADIPVIFLSANTEPHDKIKGLEMGGVDYIAKPFDRDEVLARVHTQIKIQKLTKELIQVNAELHKKYLELAEANVAITELTRTDPLTGLANRRYFMEILEKEVSLARRHQVPLCLIMADLDYFKQINDTYGHGAGDQVLQAFARLLQQNIRKEDLSARYGGEEFIIITPHTALNKAHIVAERIRQAQESLRLPGIEGRVTASFGICQLLPNDDHDSFISRADKALYQAKAEGRNRVVGAGLESSGI